MKPQCRVLSLRLAYYLSVSTCALFLACPLSVKATLADYQAAVTNRPGLISYFTFDQSNANDVRAAHNGTTQGGVTFPDGVGAAGKAIALNTVGRVTFGAVPDFDFADLTGTVEFWVRADWTGSLSYNPCLVASRNGGTVNWSIHMERDRRRIGMWNGMSYLTVLIPDAGTNWHHAAVVFDSGTVYYYWDGALAGTVPHDLGGNPTTTQLGSSSANVTAEGFSGALDEVAFHADALTEADVQAHYAALFAGTPPVITVQPRGGTYLPGVPLTLRVKATGPNLSYQWYKGTNAITGANQPELVFASLAPSDAGTYRVVVSNPAANVPSADVAVATADTLPQELTRYQSALTNEPSLLSYFTFDRLGAADLRALHDGVLVGTADFDTGLGGGPGAALFVDGTGHTLLFPVSDFDFTDGTGTVETWLRADWSSAGYDPTIFANRDGGSVTWSVHMGRNRDVIGIWNGSTWMTAPIPNPGTNWHHLAVVFNTGTNTFYWDGVARGSVEQGLGFSPASTQIGSTQSDPTAEGWIGALDEVAFYADALSAETVEAHFNAFAAGTPPVLTGIPAGGAFLSGRPLQLTVVALGANLAYQWYKDDTLIPGATNATLGTASGNASDSGRYYVRVTNPAGATNSPVAMVQVGNNIVGYQAAVLAESNLISYYRFDAGDAADAQATNPGTIVNTVTFTAGPGGVTNQAVLLDGTGHISLGAVPALDFTNGIGTAEAWVRADWTDSSYDPCLFASRIASSFQVNWSIHMARSRTEFGNWNGLFFQTVGVQDGGAWHHYAVTFGEDKVTMYWDGVPTGSFAQPINLVTGLPTQIGSPEPDSTTEGWLGAIDEVAFYQATLSADAIQRHYLAMTGGVSAPPQLQATRSGNQLTLSWQNDVSGYILEATPSLVSPSWSSVSGVVNNQVTVETTDAMRFFRLKQ